MEDNPKYPGIESLPGANLSTYYPTLRDRVHSFLQDKWYGANAGSQEDRLKAQSEADFAMKVLGLTPIESAFNAYDAGQDYEAGNYGTAALSAGLVALPFARKVPGAKQAEEAVAHGIMSIFPKKKVAAEMRDAMAEYRAATEGVPPMWDDMDLLRFKHSMKGGYQPTAWDKVDRVLNYPKELQDRLMGRRATAVEQAIIDGYTASTLSGLESYFSGEQR